MKIYFIQQGSEGPIKIGVSWDVEKRLETAKTFSPHSLQLLAIINGGRKEERHLHTKFKKERLEGEWFEASERMIQYIQTLKENDLSTPICPDGEKLITLLDAAEIMQIQPNRILGLAHRGKIPHLKIKGAIYFKETEIEEWIRNLEMSQNPPQSETAQKVVLIMR